MNLSEAFRKLTILDEDVFSIDKDGIEELKEFEDESEETKHDISVVDLEAEEEDEVKESYDGKVILDCCVCHSKIFKDPSDIVIDEESIDCVNVGEECPICCSTDGYTLIGQVAPYKSMEDEEDDEHDDDEEEAEEVEVEVKEEEETEEAEPEEADDEKEVEESLLGTALVSAAGALGGKLIGDFISKRTNEDYDKDILECQKLVDCDVDKYHKISGETMSKIKDAGLAIIRDQNNKYKVVVDVKDVAETSIDEGCSKKGKAAKKSPKANVDESIEAVNIDTGDQKISVKAEVKEVKDEEVEVEEEKAEMIVPISPETEDKIAAANVDETEDAQPEEEVVADVAESEVEEKADEDEEAVEEVEVEEEEKEEETPDDADEGEEVDVEIDEFKEESFNQLVGKYLSETYNNTAGFNTTGVSVLGNKLKIEGIIKFTSGKEKETKFIFESKDCTSNGRVNFVGENCQICRGKKAFTLRGSVKDGTLMSESLTYNYRAKNLNEDTSRRIYGTVRVDG